MKRRRHEPLVCSIGSTDPTGAAGLFADAAVYAQLGIRAVYVVSGVTAQNSAKVLCVEPLSPKAVRAQLDAVWSQVRPDAVRVGLLAGAPAAATVLAFLKALRPPPAIVVDPVIASSSGRRFAGPREVAALRAFLGVATVVTPNAPEAAALARTAVSSVADAERAALALAASGSAVLVKGAHLPTGGRIVDVLARAAHVTRYSARRLDADARGTGCTLAAVLAASLAQGHSLRDAIRRARAFVRRAIATAQPLGRGSPQLAARRP